MKYFGQPWKSMLCQICEHVPTPVGSLCEWCEEPIVAGDQGVCLPALDEFRELPPLAPNVTACIVSLRTAPYHLCCFNRSVIGSLAHLQRRCSCFGGEATDDDEPGMTKRQAAQAAVAEMERLQKMRVH